MTPGLFRIWVEARMKAEKTAHKQRAWLAFNTAALGRVAKFPTWRAFSGEKAKSQSPEEMKATMRALAGAVGSVVERSEHE
jgi:hypothetical protein